MSHIDVRAVSEQTHILVTTVNDEEGHYLRAALGDHCTLKLLLGTLHNVDTQELAQVDVLIPFIHPDLGSSELATMPKLKLIATRSTGYDHIDMTYAREHGIAVANVPGYGETAVAEYTFALLLTLSRKIHLADAQARRGIYGLEGLLGFDLYGKTLGVVGVGAIGLHVIRIARGFGMNVVAFDVQQNRLFSEILGFRYTSLDDLLTQSDIVTLHAPALASTFHMINRTTLARMKRGALLINTARGTLVDTEALVWALETGLLGGAGLDVLEGEDMFQSEEERLSASCIEDASSLLQQNHRLQQRSDVVITPHLAFNSQEALRRILDTTIENVHFFLQGKPHNLIK